MNTYHKQQIKIYVNLLLLLFQRKKHLLQRRKRKVRRIWARKWLQRRNENRGISHLVFNELEYEDPASFKNFTRMSVATFHELLLKVAPIIKKQDTVLTRSSSCKTKVIYYRLKFYKCTKFYYPCITYRLLLALRFLATGESYTSLQYVFRISVPSICNIV
jgi:hypothetical protein